MPGRGGKRPGRGEPGGPPKSAEATVDGASRSPRRPQLCVSQLVQFWGWVGGQGGPTSVRERGRSLALQTLGTPSIIRAAPRNSRANSLREQIKPFLLPGKCSGARAEQKGPLSAHIPPARPGDPPPPPPPPPGSEGSRRTGPFHCGSLCPAWRQSWIAGFLFPPDWASLHSLYHPVPGWRLRC
ncbi:hypothetical protein R6Z07F_018172 [Ovis aries]